MALAGSVLRATFMLALAGAADAAEPRPLLRDFLGINGDFNFPASTYQPLCRLARMYHSTTWDVDAPGDALNIPWCTNGVKWDRDTYGPWQAAGFTTDASIQVEGFTTGWSGTDAWCTAYGQGLAAFFGPSGSRPLITSMEIGNEPGTRIDTATFRMIFKNMAQGIRAGDPGVRILTPYVKVGAASDWNQDVRTTYADADILPLYDVLNVHTYPFAPARAFPDNNTFNQSYPEDPSLTWLDDVDAMVAWRDANAPGKEIWVTEYGYNAVTQTAIDDRSGWWLDSNWQSMSDLMQAQCLVRAAMALTGRGADRAYAFFYDDGDAADGPFGGAGLSRNGTPKMSFWAMQQVYELLGDYRLTRIVDKIAGDRCVYEFTRGDDANALVWVAWSPTGTRSDTKDGYTPRTAAVTLSGLPGTVQQVIGMATASGTAPSPAYTTGGSDISLTISESPVYIMMRVPSTNHLPAITTAEPAVLTCLEDASGNITLNASDSDGDALTWTVTTPGAHGTATLPGGTSTTATLGYQPDADLNGGDTCVITVDDGHGGSDAITVAVTITAVNDAPTFTVGPAVTVAADSGPQVIPGWVTAISAGPTDESGQSLAFTIVSDSNPVLFSTAPAVSADGVLSFTPEPGASGSASIGVRVSDDGGTAHGGIDASAVQTVSITVTAVPADPPSTAVDTGGGGGGGCGAGGALGAGFLLLGLRRRFRAR